MMKTHLGLVLVGCVSIGSAQITPIELTPTNVASGNSTFFTAFPTLNPAIFFGTDYGNRVRAVNFNTAPGGALSEGGNVNTQYASLGVTMNDIRISASIYGGNNYGAGFATEDNVPQVFTFPAGVKAVGIVNTSPDRDLIQFFSGPNATGTLLYSFRDQENVGINFNIDRFVGGIAGPGVSIGSFVVSNTAGDLELDELIFVVPEPVTTLSGVVSLSDFVGPVAQETVDVLVWGPGNTVIGTYNNVPLTASGSYSVGVAPAANCTVTVRGRTWIRSRSSVVTLVSDQGLTLNFALNNGDADQSGEVDAADIDVLIGKFGSVVGDAGFDENADLDGSTEVDAADIDVAIANFGSADE